MCQRGLELVGNRGGDSVAKLAIARMSWKTTQEVGGELRHTGIAANHCPKIAVEELDAARMA